MSLFLLLCLTEIAAAKNIVVQDVDGETISLERPARRVIALAPHVAEMLYAIGAGDTLVGTVEYSDYPLESLQVTRIGSAERFDLERILTLRPDLIIGWKTGNPKTLIRKLKQLGLKVFLSEPKRLEDIARDLNIYGALVGQDAQAKRVADQFSQRLLHLNQRYSMAPKVKVFYQIWQHPLITFGGEQMINDMLNLCGGENIFFKIKKPSTQVNVERVLLKNPEAIVVSGSRFSEEDKMSKQVKSWLDAWRRWPTLLAVQRNNLFDIHPDLVLRHTPRVLDGATKLCGFLDQVRQKRIQ